MKSSIRKEINEKIALSSEEYRREASEIIQDRFLNSVEYANSKSIFVYISTKNEVETRKIIEKAFSDGKIVSVPKIYDNDMQAIEIEKTSEYNVNKYGILEPVVGKIVRNIDLCVVPLVAFDRSLRRLGRGKGYYDRYLSVGNYLKVALAFSIQKTEFVEVEKSDVDMDIIITEKEVYK